jgi:hypothetical protein
MNSGWYISRHASRPCWIHACNRGCEARIVVPWLRHRHVLPACRALSIVGFATAQLSGQLLQSAGSTSLATRCCRTLQPHFPRR